MKRAKLPRRAPHLSKVAFKERIRAIMRGLDLDTAALVAPIKKKGGWNDQRPV